MKSDLAKVVEVRRTFRTGEALALRKAAAVSQVDMARAAGTTAGAYSRWETGDRIPRYAMALSIWPLFNDLRAGLAPSPSPKVCVPVGEECAQAVRLAAFIVRAKPNLWDELGFTRGGPGTYDRRTLRFWWALEHEVPPIQPW